MTPVLSRKDDVERALWAQMLTEVHARLRRIDRGETSAPPEWTRCLRLLVAQPSTATPSTDQHHPQHHHPQLGTPITTR